MIWPSTTGMRLEVQDWRRAARRALPRFVFEYVDGAAETETCLRYNRADFDAIRLTPRVLRDTASIDTSVQVFGQTWRWPFQPLATFDPVCSGGKS